MYMTTIRDEINAKIDRAYDLGKVACHNWQHVNTNPYRKFNTYDEDGRSDKEMECHKAWEGGWIAQYELMK